MGWDISETMSGYSAHLTTEERKYWEWNDEFFLKCVGFYIGMYFMLEGTIRFSTVKLAWGSVQVYRGQLLAIPSVRFPLWCLWKGLGNAAIK